MKGLAPFIKIAIIFLVPAFFYLNPFLPWPKDLIFEAAGHGNGVLAFFEAQKNGTPAPFFWGHSSYILGQVTLMIIYALAGATTFTTILNTSILGFLTILVTYFFAKQFLGFWSGLVALLFFSGSLFFLMVIKTAYPFYGTIPLTVALALFLFVLAHQTRKKSLLYLAGVALGLVGLAGGHGIPITLAVLIGFLGWKVVFREETFPLRFYCLSLLLALFVFFGFHALFPLINNNKPFDYLYDTYRLLSERGGQVALKGGLDGRLANAERCFRIFFIDMYIPGQGHQQFFAGRAMLPPFASLFFLWGLVVSFWKREDIDKILLLWVGGVFLFYGFFADFQVRYFLLVAPAIYFLVARGVLDLSKRIKNKAFFIFLSLVIVVHLSFTYHDYFVTMASHAFQLEQYEGQAEMADYIKKTYNPQEVFLIMGNINGVPPQNFVFYTWQKKYDFHGWDFFSERGAPYTPIEIELLRGEKPVYGEDAWRQKLIEWEEEKLKTYQKIIYIFAFYNDDLTPTREWVRFREIYPYLLPEKIILAHDQRPQMAVYEVTKEDLETVHFETKLLPNQKQTFRSPRVGKLKAIVFSGKVDNPEFYLNGSVIKMPMVTYPSEKATIVFNGKSGLVLSPSFSSLEIASDIYRAKNIIHSPTSAAVTGQPNQKGELIYRLVGPKPIERLSVLFFPRVHNDKERRVFLNLDYSSNDRDYETVYRLESNGSGGWIGSQERLTLLPQSKTVYLRFILSNLNTQLLSSQTAMMSFEGEFEGESQELKVEKGKNSFWFEGNKEPLTISLFFRPD